MRSACGALAETTVAGMRPGPHLTRKEPALAKSVEHKRARAVCTLRSGALARMSRVASA
jgi:hypothetical protein